MYAGKKFIPKDLRAKKTRAQRRERVGVAREVFGGAEADRPGQQLLHLATPVRAEPAVGLELAPQLAERVGVGVLRSVVGK